MKKSLARLDLNLLFTLQLLLQEQSVSKASKKLNVTPSTVSKSLNKLRHWFDDPLFVKTPKGLAPTPLAQSMEQDLAEWLQIGSQIAEKRSDITPKGVRFDITIESPLVLTVLDRLIVAIHQRYPEAKVKTSNWDYDSLDAIIRGEADIGLTAEKVTRDRKSRWIFCRISWILRFFFMTCRWCIYIKIIRHYSKSGISRPF